MNELWEGANALRAVVNCICLVAFAWNIPRRDLLAPLSWRTARNWRAACWQLSRAVPFALLIAVMVYERTTGYRFYYDLAIVVVAFVVYLVWTRRTSVRNATYFAVVVFLCADLCVALSGAIYKHGPTFNTAGYVAVETLYIAVMLGLCVFLRRFAPTDASRSISVPSFIILLVTLLPYVVIRSSSVLYAAEGDDALTMEALLFLTIIATLAAFVGNYASVLAEREHTRRLELEIEMRDHARRYEVRKETMTEINRRYHDMVKYARLRAQTDGKLPADDQLEERLTRGLEASSLQNTGSEILDMVLWEAGEECRRRDLRLVPAVEAHDLGFIADYDLRTIAGNALDNAIEAAANVEDPEKREVRFRVAQVNQMVFFKTVNYFAGELREHDGKLLTTKRDDGTHGFGVDNIRRAAESYDGSLLVEADGDRFTLTAMVPRPTTA